MDPSKSPSCFVIFGFGSSMASQVAVDYLGQQGASDEAPETNLQFLNYPVGTRSE
jgi:hypothetical protein